MIKNVNIDDDTYYYFSYISPYDGSNRHFIKMEKYDNGNIVDIQFNEITFNFVGYSNVYSAKFEAKYKNGIVVRSDDKTKWTVSSNLEYGYHALACNEDVSVCDIALYHPEDYSMEIHKVNITFDNSISDEFKEMFGIKADGTIDINKEESFLIENNYESVSFGTLIFRVETAAIYTASIFNFYSSTR